MCSSCPTWEPPFVSAILGEQPWAPRMPTESYSRWEGQTDKPLPQRAPGPLWLDPREERGLEVALLPPATPTPTPTAAEVQDPPLFRGHTSRQVQDSLGCNFQVQTSGVPDLTWRWVTAQTNEG